MQGWPSKHPPGAVCLVTGELTRYALSMQCINSLKAPPGSGLSWFTGVLIAKSINLSFQTVIDNPKFQWAWLMGDDHIFDPEILLRLLDRGKDIVVPLCLNRLPPFDPTVVDHTYKRMKYLEELPTSGLYKLKENETCGDAGMLVSRQALEKLGPVWYERKKSGAHSAEDQEFIAKVKENGFDIWYDLDNPIGHIGSVTYMPVRRDDKWQVRMMGGTGGTAQHIADLAPMERAVDAWRIRGE